MCHYVKLTRSAHSENVKSADVCAFQCIRKKPEAFNPPAFSFQYILCLQLIESVKTNNVALLKSSDNDALINLNLFRK